MRIQLWNLVFLIGFIVYVAIRGVFKQRTKSNEKAVNRVDALGKALLVLVIPGGLFVPPVYLFTPWLTFADYSVPTFAPSCEGLPGTILKAAQNLHLGILLSMTPEGLKAYVDAVIKNHDLWAFLAPAIASFIGVTLAFYLFNERPKNLATKKDIERITTEIESSKSFFTERLEHLKRDVGSQVHYGKVRYECETKVFEEIWPKLWSLRMAVAMLRPIMDSPLRPDETKEHRRSERAQVFKSSYDDFVRVMQQNRPFCPLGIWQELLALRILCWDEAVDSVFLDSESQKEYWTKALENTKVIDEQTEKVCEAIRIRLTEFDRV